MKKRNENDPMVKVSMFQEVENRDNDLWVYTMTDKRKNLAMKASRHNLKLAVSTVETQGDSSILVSVWV